MSKEHWQNIYNTKKENQVSWTQDFPATPINYLKEIKLAKDAKIIDIGGGSGKFVDALLEQGYNDITVLDISESALKKSQERLGDQATSVNWICRDILTFRPIDQYDFWYDRALFHFLTAQDDISNYVNLVSESISKEGHFLLGTFSENGPLKCSGLEIKQYSQIGMKAAFQQSFQHRRCFTETHITPFKTSQEFQFCGFVKK